MLAADSIFGRRRSLFSSLTCCLRERENQWHASTSKHSCFVTQCMSSLLTPHVPQMLMANIATSMWHDSESLLAPYQTGVKRQRSYCRSVRERCFLLRRTHTGPRGGFVLHVFCSRSQTITTHLNHGLILDILQRDPGFLRILIKPACKRSRQRSLVVCQRDCH